MNSLCFVGRNYTIKKSSKIEWTLDDIRIGNIISVTIWVINVFSKFGLCLKLDIVQTASFGMSGKLMSQT